MHRHLLTVGVLALLGGFVRAEDQARVTLTAEQKSEALAIQLEDARDRLVLAQLQQRKTVRDAAWKALETAVGCPVDAQTIAVHCPEAPQ